MPNSPKDSPEDFSKDSPVKLSGKKKVKAKAKKPSRAKRRKATAEALPKQPQKWLVLAGTKDAHDFMAHWQMDEDVSLVASITDGAPILGVETRIGSFSGYDEVDEAEFDEVAGMARFLKEGRFDAVVDLTHPFAAQISADGRAAAMQCDIAYFQFVRAPWRPLADDVWHYHDSWEALFTSVKTRHLFVAGGHEALDELSPSCRTQITARMSEPPHVPLSDLPDSVKVILGPPNAQAHEEEALLRKYKITAVATRLSGGKAGAAKLAAARELGLDVHMVKRPDYPEGWYADMHKFNRALGRSLAVEAVQEDGSAKTR